MILRISGSAAARYSLSLVLEVRDDINTLETSQLSAIPRFKMSVRPSYELNTLQDWEGVGRSKRNIHDGTRGYLNR